MAPFRPELLITLLGKPPCGIEFRIIEEGRILIQNAESRPSPARAIAYEPEL